LKSKWRAQPIGSNCLVLMLPAALQQPRPTAEDATTYHGMLTNATAPHSPKVDTVQVKELDPHVTFFCWLQGEA
jgi:hypothetical protein